MKIINIFSLRLFKYLLMPFNKYLRHSMFDFIVDQKNIQTNKCKAQDYYTIIQ